MRKKKKREIYTTEHQPPAFAVDTPEGRAELLTETATHCYKSTQSKQLTFVEWPLGKLRSKVPRSNACWVPHLPCRGKAPGHLWPCSPTVQAGVKALEPETDRQ